MTTTTITFNQEERQEVARILTNLSRNGRFYSEEISTALLGENEIDFEINREYFYTVNRADFDAEKLRPKYYWVALGKDFDPEDGTPYEGFDLHITLDKEETLKDYLSYWLKMGYEILAQKPISADEIIASHGNFALNQGEEAPF